MLFFRLTLVPIQEGKMGDAMSYAEDKVDEFMGLPGLLQVALCENSDGQLMSWSTWANEEAMTSSSENLAEALGGLKDYVSGPPEISFGPMTAGQQYVNIMRGDRGDGVPNFLSADNVIVVGARQKPLASKKIEKWVSLDPKDFCNEVMLRNYKRNESLVNLALIPSAIVNQINEKYDNYKIPPKSGLLNYFIKNRLKLLMDKIGEF